MVSSEWCFHRNFSIAPSSDGLCTAGADGYVKIWTRFLECRLVIELKSLGSTSGNVRCVDWETDMGRILLGKYSLFRVS